MVELSNVDSDPPPAQERASDVLQSFFWYLDEPAVLTELVRDQRTGRSDFRLLQENRRFRSEIVDAGQPGVLLSELLPSCTAAIWELAEIVGEASAPVYRELRADSRVIYRVKCVRASSRSIEVLLHFVRQDVAPAADGAPTEDALGRSMLQNSPDCVKILGTDGRLQYMSDRGLCLMEIDNFELLKGQEWWTLWGEQNAGLVRDAVSRSVRGEVVRFQAFCPTAKGTPKWWDVLVAPVWDELGNTPSRLISISRDVTERVRRDEEIGQQRRILEAVMDSSPLGLLLVSPDGKVLRYNRRFIETWSLPADLVDSRSDSEIQRYAAELTCNPDAFIQGVRTAYSGGNHHVRDEVSLRDGRVVERFGAPIRTENQNLGWLWSFMDITALRLATERLERTVQERTRSLQQLVWQLEEFSYGVSHDLRTPIRAIYGYAKVVLEDYGSHLPDDARVYLSRIITAGERMDRLTQDVLTYNKVARESIELEPVNLDALVSEVVEQCRRSAGRTSEITVEGQLPWVMAYEPLLARAITNLVQNAIKFVPAARHPRVTVRIQHVAGRVRLLIEDNGIGVPAENRERVWGMFERLYPAQHFEGSGIGLAIVRKAVERMNGRVGVESDGSTGSTFWIELLPVGG
jgi:signal transduction histidine kinase